ncbi:histidine phosphatase family protein [Paenibacillus polymyxa]|uniref:histidine phosphatase family protein n=1 Tax=Paenibacillus polymyxa TaxID=1406 RepID=UPI001869246C|nr:histidine phosphatase family protein [Paenibacillus polymyxa]MBE3650945.1 histidine phosphatase family protein [Paenibacillus polymyxa]
MNRLYITRHGEASEGSDPPLSEVGKEQVRRLGDSLLRTENLHLDLLYCSPAKRAVETATILGDVLAASNISPDPRLQERNLGNTNHIPRDTLVDTVCGQLTDFDFRFEGGESNREVMERLISLLEELRQHDNKTILLVTHRITMSLLLYHLGNFKENTFCKLMGNTDTYLIKIGVNGSSPIEPIWPKCRI